MDGEGESIGIDSVGNSYTFWRSSGHMEVPLEVIERLEKEIPQRFERVNKKSDEIVIINPEVISKVINELDQLSPKVVTLKQLKSLSKEKLNEWVEKYDYESTSIPILIKQIEKRTGRIL